jgi:diguanylate cyclase
VIAEGVETEEQRALLAKVSEIQGYLIGRPQPIAHCRHLVTAVAAARETAVIAG